MFAVTLTEMLAAEAAAMASGCTEERLLDHAGERLGLAIGRFFQNPGTLTGYLGKGHNAADTLVALRILRDQFGWEIATRNAFPIDHCAPLTQKKWRQLGLIAPLEAPPDWRDLKTPHVLLDGLLGSGSQGALAGPLLSLAQEMEWFRQHTGARVAAVDSPSGIDMHTGLASPGSVVADITFMIGNAKSCLLESSAANSTGALALVPVEVLTACGTSGLRLIAPQTMDFAKSPRPFDFHKGTAGRVAVLAGSSRYPGAAVLAAIGALRGGAGLITLHVPAQAAAVIAARCPPEIIVRAYASLRELLDFNDCNAWVIGCGLGDLDSSSAAALLDLLTQASAPAVIDADALNLIARSGKIRILTDRHVVTPHPAEFQRLAPDLAGIARELAARAFVNRSPATLLLKGCRSLVTRCGQALYCNATGNPGMATGGQGDLLAGVMGARLATGQSPVEAAALAAWLCGRAAEIALHDRFVSEESLTPSEVADHLGAAYHDWKTSGR